MELRHGTHVGYVIETADDSLSRPRASIAESQFEASESFPKISV